MYNKEQVDEGLAIISDAIVIADEHTSTKSAKGDSRGGEYELAFQCVKYCSNVEMPNYFR